MERGIEMAEPTKVALTNTFNLSDNKTIYNVSESVFMPQIPYVVDKPVFESNITPSNKANKALTKKKINKNKDIYVLRSNSNK